METLSWFMAFTLIFILLVQNLFVYEDVHGGVRADADTTFRYILWKQVVITIAH